jgi:hypothetical protein
MQIYSKSEAEFAALCMETLSDKIIRDVNKIIVDGYSIGAKHVIFSQTSDMTTQQWRKLGTMLKQTGYKISAVSRRDGQWYMIEL